MSYCTGFSGAGGMITWLAVRLNWMDIEEKLLIVYVRGNEKIPVGTVLSGGKVISMHGCLLDCIKTCMSSLNKEYLIKISIIFITYYVLFFAS